MRKLAWTCALLLTVPALAAWLEAPKAPTSLHGLWSQTEPTRDDDLVRFYYFHAGNIGIYRYGKMGYTQTRSFKYEKKAEKLLLVFLEDGAHHEVPYTVDGQVLTLNDDPMLGGQQRYTLRSAASSDALAASDHPLARLWTSTERDRDGKESFRMYQLQPPAIDGRGVGWYHQGNYRDWTTEALTYRKAGDTLTVQFNLRGERSETSIEIGQDDQGRFLRLGADPRNFWHPRRFSDGGPGFSVSLHGEPMPYFVPGHGVPGGHGAPAGHGTPSGHGDPGTDDSAACPHGG